VPTTEIGKVALSVFGAAAALLVLELLIFHRAKGPSGSEGAEPDIVPRPGTSPFRGRLLLLLATLVFLVGELAMVQFIQPGREFVEADQWQIGTAYVYFGPIILAVGFFFLLRFGYFSRDRRTG